MAVPMIDGRAKGGTKADLAVLADTFLREIKASESARQERVDDYELYIENYEGDTAPPESEKPWEGASDAHIDKTATDVDVTYARFMNAIFGQFPKFMIRPLSPKSINFARMTQRFSEWLEESEIPLYKTMQEALLTTIKFGSAVVYIPWENRPIKHMRLDENDEFQEEEIDIANKPVLKVIHPKDWIMPRGHRDIQKSPWVAYRYELREPNLKLWTKRGFFRKDVGEELLKILQPQRSDKKGHLAMPDGESREDRVVQAQERAAGIAQTKNSDSLQMLHVWARIDIDGDGLEEEVNFHIHEKTGQIARIAYNHYRHAKRPFVDFHFFPREGLWDSIGICEMLSGTQKNINITFRQIQDNNTVKNTQTFKAKENGAIGPNETFHPARIYFVREMDDFEAMRMGDTGISTSVQDLGMMLDWGDRRTGINDPAQGVSSSDRTPATTTLALLQEASRRIDLIIGQTRESLAELWMQVLELYTQFKPVVEFEWKEGEKVNLMEWDSMSDEEFRKRILVKPTASTSALNKAVARTENQGLLESMMGFNQSQATMIDYYLAATDPFLKGYLQKSIEGQHKVMQRVLDTFEFAKDEDEILPNPEELLNVTPVQPPLAPTVGANGGNPGGTAPGVGEVPDEAAAGVIPRNAPGRPGQDGLPRLPGVPPGGAGEA